MKTDFFKTILNRFFTGRQILFERFTRILTGDKTVSQSQCPPAKTKLTQLTQIDGRHLRGHVLVQVRASQRVEGCRPGPVQQLPQEEDVLVLRQMRHDRRPHAAVDPRRVPGRHQAHVLLLPAERVLAGHVVWQREHERAEGQYQDAAPDEDGLAAGAAQVAHGDETEERGDVVTAGDQPGLGASQLVPLLDGGDNHVDEPEVTLIIYYIFEV